MGVDDNQRLSGEASSGSTMPTGSSATRRNESADDGRGAKRPRPMNTYKQTTLSFAPKSKVKASASSTESKDKGAEPRKPNMTESDGSTTVTERNAVPGPKDADAVTVESAPAPDRLDRYERKPYQRAQSTDYYPSHRPLPNSGGRLSRDDLRDIAASTIEAIDRGSYTLEGTQYDLRDTVDTMIADTIYYPPDASELKDDSMDVDAGKVDSTDISLLEISTLEGARYLHTVLSSRPDAKDKRIGVLNFASAKKPGGGFINGARAQEESIARSSTLYASLMIDVAQEFYALHARLPHVVPFPESTRRGTKCLYTHAMIYSPRVQLIKDDAGEWVEPIEVEVLTSPAVNAGVVRRDLLAPLREERPPRRYGVKSEDAPDSRRDAKGKRKLEKERMDPWAALGEGRTLDDKAPDSSASSASSPTSKPSASSLSDDVEELITSTMRERMARILDVFRLQKVTNLVLGSFGTGVFQNHVNVIARIWVELLVGDGDGDGDGSDAPFKGCFERVVFAILGAETFEVFENVFAEAGVGTGGGSGSSERVEGRVPGTDDEGGEMEKEKKDGKCILEDVSMQDVMGRL